VRSIRSDTIAAVATPHGNGGIGIIRISGRDAATISKQLIPKKLLPRQALFSQFLDTDGSVLDSGIAIYFPAPHSYTGENVLELQGHGGSVILDMILRRVLALGARMANPGEFTERAFLNNKLDLAQAEAVADLIESSTEQSVRSAQKSMQGVFSERINELLEDLVELRIYIEAAIDFVDEEIDFLGDGAVENRINKILQKIIQIKKTAIQGRLLKEGMTVVLAGRPNAGKSSLLNILAGHEAAIVTDIEGTTRDVLRERIQIDGMPLHIIDTAGLRDSDHAIEKEGVRRAHDEISKADRVLLVIDAQQPEDTFIAKLLPENIKVTRIYNKIDLLDIEPKIVESEQGTHIYVSIKNKKGLDLLTNHLKACMGFNAEAEDVFISRRRHIEAIERAADSVENAISQLVTNQAGELVAEDLRQAQNSLSEITGKFTSDDLLGKIFSSFCVGK
jgi:tRNA modification GTPase